MINAASRAAELTRQLLTESDPGLIAQEVPRPELRPRFEVGAAQQSLGPVLLADLAEELE